MIAKAARIHNINSINVESNPSTSGERKPPYTVDKITNIGCEGTSQYSKPEQMNENEMPNH